MRLRYDYGDAVRVLRNVRNDGTYGGLDTGTLLVRRGAVGHVQNVGTFLQDQIIYSVHFLDEDKVVGCREQELQPADAPWQPSRFETREHVICSVDLAIHGEVIAPRGSEGEVLKVLREDGDAVRYHVHFPGHTLLVREGVLEPAGQ